ncbi:MAG: HAD family hydrolase [Chloroflexi bacterium]|nr:MAG: HAD family hydrolase [Chloroflexota bacterium]
MIKAVLLDLDQTLLNNPIDAFLMEYFNLLEVFFKKRGYNNSIQQALMACVADLERPHDITLTNYEVFMLRLEKELKRSQSGLKDDFDIFYGEVYPQLKRCTAPVEGVQRLIEALLSLDLSLIIATNPLFPTSAIEQRLHWAGFSDLTQFAFITTAENMHFAKPNPAYYAEILARVGIEPDEAIMVGDDVRNDIEAAATLGIYTYHVVENVSQQTQADRQGTIIQLEAAFKQRWHQNLAIKPLHPKMIAPQFIGNVGALFGLLDQVQPHYWEQHPDPEEWSILQIVCHLLESEVQVQRPRLLRILEEDNPFLTAPKTPPGPQSPPCAPNGLQVAKDFAKERQNTIKLLSTLNEAQWYRPARHYIFSHTNLLEMAHFTAQHDRLHINQLCETLGNCH